MAKIAQTRFPDPPEQYDPRAFSELVRQLEQIVLQLNSSYQEDNRNEILRRVNFLQGDGNDPDGVGIALSDLSVSTGSASGGGSLSYNNTTGVFSFVPASVPTVSNTPSFSVQRTTGQSLTDNSNTVILFNTVNHDTDSAYNTSTGEFTVPSGKAGKYFFAGHVRVDSTTDFGRLAGVIQVNGNTKATVNNVNRDEDSTMASLVIDLSAGDQVKFAVFQNSGGAKNTKSADNVMFMGFKLI